MVLAMTIPSLLDAVQSGKTWPHARSGLLALALPCAAVAAAGAEQAGPPTARNILTNGSFEAPFTAAGTVPGWTLKTFGKSPSPLLERCEEQAGAGRACLRIGFPEDAGGCSFSFFQTVADLDVNDRLVMSFRYCVVSTALRHGIGKDLTPVLVQVSAAPGGVHPTVAVASYWTVDQQWHEVKTELNPRRLAESSVVEFRVRGGRAKTDVLLIDDVSLAYAPGERAVLDVVAPANCVFYTDDDGPRTLEFSLRAPRRFTGAGFSVSLVFDRAPHKTVANVAATCAYPETRGRFDVSKLQPGPYTLRAVQSGVEKPLAAEAGFAVTAPAGDAVRVRDNTLYVGGKRFLAFGL